MAVTRLVDYCTDETIAAYDGILLRPQVQRHAKDVDAFLLDESPELYFEGKENAVAIYYVESWETYNERVQYNPSLWTTQKLVTTY